EARGPLYPNASKTYPNAIGPPLPGETVSAAKKIIKVGMTSGQAARQLNIGRAMTYRIAQSLR
ncbi:MAG: hypothetical protein OXH76_07040, partial [Boseongicola sp.]|nr:hypothetical protein [Boseongicola sp.]